MRGNITKTTVDRLAEGWLWDSGPRAVVGFGARRQTEGMIFFYLRYRIAGRQRYKSIGRLGSPWTVETARNEARRLLGLVASGFDPGQRLRSAETFGVEMERYLASRKTTLKPRSFIETERHLRQHAKPLHGLALTEINRRAIAVLLERIATGSGLVTRNRVRASLSAFFTWTITEGLLDLNPVTGTATADEGGSRSRVLTDAELALVWRSLDDDAYGDIVRLLILTGQRREEIGGLRWDEIIGEDWRSASADFGSICFPPERTKNSQEHKLPLSRQAREIIDRQPRRNSSPLIFIRGECGTFGWSFYKAQLDARIADADPTMPPWRLHDLRRTVATGMAELGVNPWVVEAVLNHISGHKSGVAGIYNRARYEAEMRDALQRWGDYVTEIIAPASDGQTTIALGAPAHEKLRRTGRFEVR